MTTTTSHAVTISKLDAEICADAIKFLTLYNKVLDTPERRSSVKGFYSKEGAYLIWNGNAMLGKEQIIDFWNRYPSTKHDVFSLDAHPLEAAGAGKCLILQAVGNVSIGGVSHAYNQVMILAHEEGIYVIKSDCLRLID